MQILVIAKMWSTNSMVSANWCGSECSTHSRASSKVSKVCLVLPSSDEDNSLNRFNVKQNGEILYRKSKGENMKIEHFILTFSSENIGKYSVMVQIQRCKWSEWCPVSLALMVRPRHSETAIPSKLATSIFNWRPHSAHCWRKMSWVPLLQKELCILFRVWGTLLFVAGKTWKKFSRKEKHLPPWKLNTKHQTQELEKSCVFDGAFSLFNLLPTTTVKTSIASRMSKR